MRGVEATNAETEALSAPRTLILDTWPAGSAPYVVRRPKRRFLVSPSASQPGTNAALSGQPKMPSEHIRREK
jgi:hypothetical protein